MCLTYRDHVINMSSTILCEFFSSVCIENWFITFFGFIQFLFYYSSYYLLFLNFHLLWNY